MSDPSPDDLAERLATRIASRSAPVAIIGLGYVGLPLLRAVHDAGFPTIGYDRDPAKIEDLRAGRTYLRHFGADFAQPLAASSKFRATCDAEDLAEAEIHLLCLPTPLGPHREPDLGYVLAGGRMVGAQLKPGRLVVLESTTFPGTTRDHLLPVLEATSGLVGGRDFFVAYAPEREDPGRAETTTKQIPKVLGGLDDASGALAEAFYAAVLDRVHRVSSAEVAEAAKLLENVYRAVNIALVNELKVMLDRMGLDAWEVIEAAATKPFGFQRFDPGPGLGGHCIPIDPFYLAWKAREVGLNAKFVELAGEINAEMPGFVVTKIAAALNDAGRALRGARILVLGVAYKRNVDDIRESPAAEIIERLRDHGAIVAYHDPHVPRFPAMRNYDIGLHSVALDEAALAGADAVVIVTDHDAVDYAMVAAKATLVVDTRNAMARIASPRARIVKA